MKVDQLTELFENPDEQAGALINLAITRFLYFTILFILIGSSDYFLNWNQVPEEFWNPAGLLKIFDSRPVPNSVHAAVFYFWRWSLLLCAFGVCYRVIAPVNFLAGFLLMNYAHSFGYRSHTFMPVLLAGLPLALAQASDALSFDRIVFFRSAKRTADSRVYLYPLKTMHLVFCSIFFIAAIAKLRASGSDWVTSDTLRNYFMRASFVYSDVNRIAGAVRINEWLYNYPLVCHFLAGFAIIAELTAPMAFFKPRLARLIIPGILLMQLSIFFTIYVNFQLYFAIYVAWVNWAWIGNRLGRIPRAIRRR